MMLQNKETLDYKTALTNVIMECETVATLSKNLYIEALKNELTTHKILEAEVIKLKNAIYDLELFF